MSVYLKGNNMEFKDPYSKKIKLKRIIWNIIWGCFAKPIPYAIARKWKLFLINLFGGHVKYTCVIYSSAKIFMPWNLYMDDYATIASNVDVYNAAPIYIGKYAIVSQYAYLCTATHDVKDKDFLLFSRPIHLGDNSWVAARSYVGPGVSVGEGAVVGATASVYKDIEAWSIVGGNPAKFIHKRTILKK